MNSSVKNKLWSRGGGEHHLCYWCWHFNYGNCRGGSVLATDFMLAYNERIRGMAYPFTICLIEFVWHFSGSALTDKSRRKSCDRKRIQFLEFLILWPKQWPTSERTFVRNVRQSDQCLSAVLLSLLALLLAFGTYGTTKYLTVSNGHNGHKKLKLEGQNGPQTDFMNKIAA